MKVLNKVNPIIFAVLGGQKHHAAMATRDVSAIAVSDAVSLESDASVGTNPDCTKEFCESQLNDNYMLRYKVNVPASTTSDVCDGCTITMEATYSGEAWVAIGFSTDGLMTGSEAVIGVPSDSTVQKYNLNEGRAVVPMAENQQTLTDTSIEVVDGETIVKFTKIMKEAGEIEILLGGNTFLWAHGSGPTLGYHGGRDTFMLDLSPGATVAPTTPQADTPAPVPATPAAPAGPARDCTKELCDSQLSAGYLLRYQINVPDDTTVDVCDACTITMELTYNDDAWVAIGFSTDGLMTGSEAVIGVPSDSTVQKYNLNEGRAVVPMPKSQQTLTDTSIEVVDGETIVKFTKIMKEAGEIEITTGDNTFLWAYGTGTTLGFHADRSPFALNLSSGASEEVAVANKSVWLAHGIMAFCAWGVFVPFAVQSSLLRQFLPAGPLWFKLHRGFNSVAFLFFIIIFVIAVVVTSQEGGSHFDNAHQTMGLAMFIMATIQVAGGVFRPHTPEEGEEKTSVRAGWEVIHRVLGVTLLACGFWQMREGIELFAGKYSLNDGGIGIAYWVWIGIMSALIVAGIGLKLMKSNSGN